MKKLLIFLSGVVVGAVSVKKLPNTRAIKALKLGRQAIEASRRLNKIVTEEYYRIDEAMKAEEQYMNLIGQDLGFQFHFEVIDLIERRKVKMNVKFEKFEMDFEE